MITTLIILMLVLIISMMVQGSICAYEICALHVTTGLQLDSCWAPDKDSTRACESWLWHQLQRITNIGFWLWDMYCMCIIFSHTYIYIYNLHFYLEDFARRILTVPKCQDLTFQFIPGLTLERSFLTVPKCWNLMLGGWLLTVPKC